MTLSELLKQEPDLDIDTIVGNECFDFALCWSEDLSMTPLAQEKFKEVMETEVRVHNDNYCPELEFVGGPVGLIREFIRAVAGYIPESEYDSYFIWAE